MARQKRMIPGQVRNRNGLQVRRLKGDGCYAIRWRIGTDWSPTHKITASDDEDAFDVAAGLRKGEAAPAENLYIICTSSDDGIKTFGKLCDSFQATRKRAVAEGTRREGTLRRENQDIARLQRYISDSTPLSDITADTITHIYVSMRSDGCNPSQLRHAHTMAKRLFAHAVDNHWIPRNPVAEIPRDRIPPVPHKDVERTLQREVDEADAIKLYKDLQNTPPSATKAAVALAMLAGLRGGEILALTWSDIHLEADNQYVVVNKAVSDSDKLQSVKAYSDRIVAMSLDLAVYLSRWKSKQKDELKALKIRQTDATPVITNKKGLRMPYYYLTTQRQKYFASLGLGTLEQIKGKKGSGTYYHYSGAQLHSLRRIFAVLLNRQNISDYAIQETLGHNDVTTTRSWYLRGLSDQKKAVASAIDQSFADAIADSDV